MSYTPIQYAKFINEITNKTNSSVLYYLMIQYRISNQNVDWHVNVVIVVEKDGVVVQLI